MPRTLTDEDVEAIATCVAAKMREQTASAVVLTRTEAKAYVKRKSEGAFSEWCKRFSVRPAFRGRYSKAHLDVALSREARLRG